MLTLCGGVLLGVYTCSIAFHTFPSTGAVVVILWYGARLVVYGEMTPGDLSAFVLYVVFVGSSVGGITGTLAQLIQAVGAWFSVVLVDFGCFGWCWVVLGIFNLYMRF